MYFLFQANFNIRNRILRSLIFKMTDQHSDLTEEVVNVLSEQDDSAEALKRRNQTLQGLLSKIIDLLKEKTSVCLNLEKQNSALHLQISSLKDIVAITKNLLGIRNMEVENMQKDLNSLQDKISAEKERHNKMVESIANANKLNEDIKGEYQNQMNLFQQLRTKYNEKIALLNKENENLKSELKTLKEESSVAN